MADVPESSLNPDAPEYIPIPTPAPLPRPPRRPMHMLLPVHQFLPVMLPTHQFLPVMLSTHPYPIVDSPPQENVRRRRHRRSIPPRVGGLERRISMNETTVMIKNIPFHYNRGLMMRFLDDFCLQENRKARDSNGENIHVFAYDYLYLPLHFKKNRIIGYAFVNFTDQRTLWNFFLAFSDGVKAFPDSARSVKITTAYIQGKNDLRRRYQYARFRREAIGFYPPRDGSQIIASGEI